eukprot:1208427-Amphidinium_carterae.1
MEADEEEGTEFTNEDSRSVWAEYSSDRGHLKILQHGVHVIPLLRNVNTCLCSRQRYPAMRPTLVESAMSEAEIRGHWQIAAELDTRAHKQ